MSLDLLNRSQHNALVNRLDRSPAVDGVQGPAGTGKTEVAAHEAYLAAYESGERVLIAALQNAAVDQILQKTIRLALSTNIAYNQIVRDIKRTGNLNSADQALHKHHSRNPGDLSDTKIVGTTLYSAFVPTGRRILEQGSFDRVIIDEAGQITPEQAWQVMRLIRNSDTSSITAYGDDIQLPPISYDFLRESSILRRMRERNRQLRMLDTTYRLNYPGVRMTSEIFYEGHLQAPEEVKSRRLILNKAPSGRLKDALDPANTLVYISVKGEETGLGWSFDNPNQSRVAAELCHDFINLGSKPTGISVIAAYSPHIRTTNVLLQGTGVQCKTVHKMLGGENDIVIFLTTRSNSNNDLGFIIQPEILNVATSRQLRKLIIVGDAKETFSEGSATSKKMFDFISSNACMINLGDY